MKLSTVATMLLLVLAPGSRTVFAQVRLYDAKRDAAAQDAKKSADRIRNGELFRKQAANVQELIRRDITTTVADARVEMQAKINALRQWSDVDDLHTEPPPSAPPAPADIAARTARLAKAKDQIKAQINALSDAAGDDGGLKSAIDKLGDIDAVLKFASTNVAAGNQGVENAISALDQLQGLYKSYQDQFDAVNKAAAKLNDLKVDVKIALLARLKVDEDYLTTQVALHARNTLEEKQVAHWRTQCAVPANIPKDELIEVTLDRLASSPNQLERAVRALYACGSLAAEGALPQRLLKLRLAQLEHVRSIRISAANARIYESVLGGGVERLALFYQGGIKPEALAQIIQALSAAGIFGKLVTQ